MSGPIVLALPALAALSALTLVLILVPRRRRQVALDPVAHPHLEALRRKTTWARNLGLVAGVLAAWVVASSSAPWARLGRGLMLAPLVFGGVLLLALIAGDLTGRRDALTSRPGPRRTLITADATTGDGPRAALVATTGLGATVLLLLAVAWAAGRADDMGRPGRALTVGSADGLSSASAGPWPGAFYGTVAIPGVVGVLALLVAGLIVVARRPRDRSDAEIARVDDVVRRREAESLCAAAGVSLGAFTVGICGVMSTAILRVQPEATARGLGTWYTGAGWLAVVVGLAALVVTIWSVTVLLLPGPAKARGVRTAVATEGRR